jgi:hypothetical protein
VANSTTTATGQQTGGTHAIGETFVLEACGFAPGSSEKIAVNGVAAGTKTADGSSCVKTTIKVVSSTGGEVNDPVPVPIRCGQNTVTATGVAASRAPLTVTTAFTVNCGTTALTGANVSLFVGLALVLLVVGGGLIFLERRKARRVA